MDLTTSPMADMPENPWSSTPRPENKPWPPKNAEQKKRSGGGKTPPPLFTFPSDMPVGRMIGLGLGAVVLLWLASGLYRVQPEENAAVLRFGKYTGTVTDPGLHYHMPWPVESILKPNVMFERRIELGYRGLDYGDGVGKQDMPEESMMLTGDANIVDLDFVVQWKIANAKQFLFNIREAEGTLKRVAESAMREVIGQNALQDIITDRREDIAVRVKKIMQSILDSYGSGIMVTQVLIQDASVPAPVLDAFEDVIRATQQAETTKNQALRYRNEIIPRAQGDAIRLVKEAEAYKEQIVSEATGNAQRFTDIYEAYAQAPQVTKERMYIEAWQYILENNKSIILDSANGHSPMSYLNLNALQKAQESK